MQTYQVQHITMYRDNRPVKSNGTMTTDLPPDAFIAEMAKHYELYVWPESDDPHKAGCVTIDLHCPAFTSRYYFLPVEN